MKKTMAFALGLLLSSPVFAKLDQKNIKCSFDAWSVPKSSIELEITMGGAPENSIEIAGHKVAVGFFPGSAYEGQQVLTLRLNDNITQVYDPKAQSLVVVSGPGMSKLQCYAQ